MSALSHLRRALIGLIAAACLTLAALQNVTVDDAVLVGPVVPVYLPSLSNWNIGQTCTTCYVHPDPALAYNGTWHDATYGPTNGYAQSFTFTFTGSGIYVFFILANNVPSATTLTNVSFLLDNAIVGTFLHQPTTSTDYQYNVAAYANGALPYGQHTMVVQPADTSTNASQVLILFDYLIYTTNSTNTSSSVTSSASPSSSPSPSQTPPATSSHSNNAAVIGGVVGGIAFLLLVLTAGFLCYRRSKRRENFSSKEEIINPFGPLPPPAPVTTTFYRDTPSPVQEINNPRHVINPTQLSNSAVHVHASSAPASVITSSSRSGSDGPSPTGVHGLIEQVGLLREELAHIRQMRTEEQHYELGSLPPPQYYESVGEHRG